MTEHSLVIRSPVPALNRYGDYLQYLRRDFIYSCCYCSITESEATTIRFTIDHYVPVSHAPELEREYSNLMYCCGLCNSRKSSIHPPAEAQAAGKRYFRADYDLRPDHFEDAADFRIQGVSSVGQFTIDYLDLNKGILRRLREIRLELSECQSFATHGMAALVNLPIDLLPPRIKAKAKAAIDQVVEITLKREDAIDALLNAVARNPLDVDDVDSHERAAHLAAQKKELRKIYSGSWNSRRAAKKTTK